MKRVNHIVYYFGLILMLLSGTFYGIGELSGLQPILLAVSLVVICVSSGKLYFQTNSNNIVSRIFIVFIISIAVSFIDHPEKSMIITVLGLVLLAYALFVEIPGLKKTLEFSYKDDMYILMITLLIIQLYSVFRGFSFYRFAGIFSNSNFAGGEAATLCALACAFFLQYHFDEKENRRIVVPIIAVIISTVICLATNSRTSVAAIAFMLLITGLLSLRVGGNIHLLKRISALIILVAVSIFVLSRIPFVKASINENITKITLRRGNELAGRQVRWDTVFNRLKFFGNGEASAFGTHNTFLSMLDQYGYIPFVLLILFILIGLFFSIKLALSKENYDMKYLPLFCFICFGITCMFEQMLLKNIMLLCMYSVPLLSQIKKRPIVFNSHQYE